MSECSEMSRALILYFSFSFSVSFPIFRHFYFHAIPFLSLSLLTSLPQTHVPPHPLSTRESESVGTLRMRERHKQKERGRELVQLRLYLGCFGVPLQTDLEGTLPMKESKRESARPFNSCFPSFPFYVGTPSHSDCQQSWTGGRSFFRFLSILPSLFSTVSLSHMFFLTHTRTRVQTLQWDTQTHQIHSKSDDFNE